MAIFTKDVLLNVILHVQIALLSLRMRPSAALSRASSRHHFPGLAGSGVRFSANVLGVLVIWEHRRGEDYITG